MKKTETICVHGNMETETSGAFGSISMPIYQTATFAHPGVGESTGYDYSRVQNPTREALERTVCELEQGQDAIAFSSGMAALSCLMECFRPGDEILAGDDLYGGSNRLFDHINRKNGIRVVYVDTRIPEAVKNAVSHRTKAIFIETPTNPMMHVTDIRAMAEIARTNHLTLIVDNTFLTPYYQKPLLLGAHIVLHSATKYLGGHNDTLAGLLVTADREWADRLRFVQKTVGTGLAPLDSWLILRGIKTLALRMERQSENAAKLAEWLAGREKVKAVYYVGSPEHPGYELHRKQAGGAGGMLSFRADSRETAEAVLNRVKLIRYAESLGGVESLITYPMRQTHADIPEEERKRKGIDDTLLRFSAGIEHIEDLIEDLEQSML